jgi:hypothetical protein
VLVHLFAASQSHKLLITHPGRPKSQPADSVAKVKYSPSLKAIFQIHNVPESVNSVSVEPDVKSQSASLSKYTLVVSAGRVFQNNALLSDTQT